MERLFSFARCAFCGKGIIGRFISLLAGGPLLGDGGTGTSLVKAGVQPEACFDELNRSNPDVVTGVHRAFADAGSHFVETNTWGANRYKLDKHGLAADVAELNRLGVSLARVSPDVLVAGSVGPLGVRLAPYGRVQPEEATAAMVRSLPAGVVLDLKLGEGRGEAFLEILKAGPSTAAIPVVIVTVEDDDGRSQSLGADDYLTKPIDRVRLERWLARVAAREERPAPVRAAALP